MFIEFASSILHAVARGHLASYTPYVITSEKLGFRYEYH